MRQIAITRVPAVEAVKWVRQHAGPGDAIVAVDAPLIIRNATGMREADRAAHRQYGRYHAGCYPANLGLGFAPLTTGFSAKLRQLGFRHNDQLNACAGGRYQVEVFPHAGYVQLFGLERILKYKKGRLNERRSGLMQLASLLEGLSQLDPPLSGLALPAIPSSGAALKAVEDQLDALLCAYLGAYWWRWGMERNDVLGDSRNGYIVVPKRSGDRDLRAGDATGSGVSPARGARKGGAPL